jgi:Na+/glutamate symporter
MARREPLKRLYIYSGVGLALVSLLLYLVAPSMFPLSLVIESYIVGYGLLILTYAWYTGIDSENPRKARRIGRFIAMFSIAVIFMFVNAGILGAVEALFPSVHSYPVYLLTSVGIVPGIIVGALIGDWLGKRNNYRPYNYQYI